MTVCNTLCTSGFVDDVVFSDNGAIIITTRMFRPILPVAAPVANSAVSDSFLFFSVLFFCLKFRVAD